jgi:O-antigen ligase
MRTEAVFKNVAQIGVLSLPFTGALVLNVGFPLKIYELLFPIAAAIWLLDKKTLKVSLSKGLYYSIASFLFVCLYSTILACLEDGGVGQTGYRGGRVVDGILRMCYLMFNATTLVLLFNTTALYPKHVLQAWTVGLYLTLAYQVFSTFAFVLFGRSILLPGMVDLQIGQFLGIDIPRSGTFVEGNFAGLYYLLSITIADLRRRNLDLGLAVVGLFFTLSTSALIGLVFLLAIRGVLKRGNIWSKTFLVVALAAASQWIFSVFDLGAKFSLDSVSSSSERLNTIMSGYNMFLERPLLGFGLGGYGFVYWIFEWDSRMLAVLSDSRQIANNIYVELIAETGILGLLSFGAFYYCYIVNLNSKYAFRLLLPTSIAILVVFMAYPTFNITFVWAFWGISLGISKCNASPIG